MIDGGLAAHRRVNLSQQRGGHLHIGHTAHVASRSKAGHVAHHPTTQCVKDGLAIESLAQQFIEDQVERGPVLVDLAIGQGDGANAHMVLRQHASQPLGIQRGHGGVGDDEGFGRCRTARHGADHIKQLATNEDVVAAFSQIDGDLLGRDGICHRRILPRSPRAQCACVSAPSTGEGTVSIDTSPASSSCISSMLMRLDTEGRPVSIT